MKRVTYLRIAACLPLVPIAAVPILRSGVDLSGVVGDVLGILVASVVIGGVPYAAAAALSLYLLRGKPPAAYWHLARWAPLIFVPVFGVALALAGLAFEPSRSLTDLSVVPIATASYAIFILPVGYAYVLVAWLGYRLLDQIGLLEGAA